MQQTTSLVDLAKARAAEDIGRVIASKILASQDPNLRPWTDYFVSRWPGSAHADSIKQKAAVQAINPQGAADLVPNAVATALALHADAGSVFAALKARAVRVPFSIVVSEANVVSGFGWGEPIPVTALAFDAPTLVQPFWHSVIVTVANELARATDGRSTALIRERVATAEREAIDFDLLDPLNAGVADKKPPSLTNAGSPVISPTGSDVSAAVSDLMSLISEARARDMRLRSCLFLLSSQMGAALRSLGDPFLDIGALGGSVFGIDAATSDSAPSDVIALVDCVRIFVADDEQVVIDVSGQASLQLLDNPTQSALSPTTTSTVHLFQVNSTAIRARRRVNWLASPNSVIYLDGAAYGGGGSPS